RNPVSNDNRDQYQDRGAAAEQATAGLERSGNARQPRAFYAFYWLASISYSAALIWLIVAAAGDALMNWLGVIGALLTLGLVVVAGQRFVRPVLRALRVQGAWGARRSENLGLGVRSGRRGGAGTAARPYRAIHVFRRLWTSPASGFEDTTM